MTRKVTGRFLLPALCALVCAAGCARSAEPRRQETKRREPRQQLAEQLIAASEIHVVYAESVAAGFRASARQGGTPEEKINCVTTKMTPELVRPALVEAYEAEFSEDELRQAASFFESPAGKAYVRSTAAELREAFGIPTEKAPELTADENARVDAFLRTRLARVMGEQGSPVNDAVRAKLQPRFTEIFRQCR